MARARLLHIGANFYAIDIIAFVRHLPEVGKLPIDLFHFLVVELHQCLLASVMLLRDFEGHVACEIEFDRQVQQLLFYVFVLLISNLDSHLLCRFLQGEDNATVLVVLL